MKILQVTLEMLGIVLLRFKLLPRLWAVTLILVNLASLYFFNTIYGQIAFVAVSFGLMIMVFLYLKLGFVRLLGVGHIFWVPMIYWMVTEIPFSDDIPYLAEWIWCLIFINGISLIIDAIDVTRYIRGERNPHYSWN